LGVGAWAGCAHAGRSEINVIKKKKIRFIQSSWKNNEEYIGKRSGEADHAPSRSRHAQSTRTTFQGLKLFGA
jgi:hypothetical protein